MLMPQGVTGQVCGRSRLSSRRTCKWGIEHVRNWSLWPDLKILARMILTVLSWRAIA
jgi:lipopolysaccharide/colanic/teichoic acid biosynthesis glycosyltransferase